jgi:hypothetical protein
MSSHAGDDAAVSSGNGAATQGCTDCVKVAQPPELGASKCCHNVKKSDICAGS